MESLYPPQPEEETSYYDVAADGSLTVRDAVPRSERDAQWAVMR